MKNKVTIEFTIDESNVGLRIDKVLGQHPQIGTRSRALNLLQSNHVLVNSKVAKPSQNTQLFDHVVATLEVSSDSTEIVPYDFQLDILFEDEDLIVVNKPAGLVVHPAAGHQDDTLVNALVHHTKNLSMKFGENRPGIVHRIDKETSGLLVIAKNDETHASLAAQFKQKTTHRVYFAVVHGALKNTEGTIQSFLARHPVDRKRYASVLDRSKKIIHEFAEGIDGKWAVTRYKLIETVGELSLIRLQLETGRTHQIRVHLSELGHPIVGDSTYGADKKIKSIHSHSIQKDIRDLSRFLLNAAELGFVHPTTKQNLNFKVDWPPADKTLIQKWRFK